MKNLYELVSRFDETFLDIHYNASTLQFERQDRFFNQELRGRLPEVVGQRENALEVVRIELMWYEGGRLLWEEWRFSCDGGVSCKKGFEGRAATYNTNLHFQDAYNPSTLELEEFELQTGVKHPLVEGVIKDFLNEKDECRVRLSVRRTHSVMWFPLLTLSKDSSSSVF